MTFILGKEFINSPQLPYEPYKMNVIDLGPKPKKESKINALAREQLQAILDNLTDEPIFALAVVAMTDKSTHDFYLQEEGHCVYSFVGAVECLKRDMMRTLVESRHRYVEYDDLD